MGRRKKEQTDDELMDETSFSAMEQLAQNMAGLGFRRKPSRDRNTCEFAKVYTDPNGKVARVTAVVDLSAAGVEPEKVRSFVVTTQTVVLPDDLSEKEGPKFCRTDMARIMEFFLTASAKSCTSCGASVSGASVAMTTASGVVCTSCTAAQD